jgi:hypothetical protein
MDQPDSETHYAQIRNCKCKRRYAVRHYGWPYNSLVTGLAEMLLLGLFFGLFLKRSPALQ